VLEQSDYPNKENQTSLNNFLSSPKLKILVIILCVFAFVFYLYDKSILPQSCPKHLHEIEPWLSSDIMQFLSDHSHPFVHKEPIISNALSEDGLAFFE